MMWLGRIDFPFLHTDSDTGKPELVRRSVDAALALRSLMDDGALARWKRIDGAVRAFVGEPDSMAPPEVDRLKADLGLTGNDLAASPTTRWPRPSSPAAYGRQKILSQIVIQAPHEGDLAARRHLPVLRPALRVRLARLLQRGLRPRQPPPKSPAMMPNPLDVAFAALGNDQAAQLLASSCASTATRPRWSRCACWATSTAPLLGGQPLQPVAGRAARAVAGGRTSAATAPACPRWPRPRPGAAGC